MYKPKQEIKDCVKMLRLYAEEIQSNELTDWFNSVALKDEEANLLAKENVRLKNEIQELQSSSGNGISPKNVVACESCKQT